MRDDYRADDLASITPCCGKKGKCLRIELCFSPSKIDCLRLG